MSLSLIGPLVTPESPSAGEELQAEREAALASPEAVAAREASRTRYENQDQAQAIQTLGEAFPAVVDRQDGGPPPLAEGEKSLGFKNSNIEQIETGSGDVGVVQSTAPVAVSSGNGHWDAVNLAPQEAAGGFEAQRPLVAMRIPKHLDEGAQIPSVGVSLMPVDVNGNPLGGSEGVADGQGVLFANTQADTDTVLKPSLFGVETTAVLRSIASPEVLYYRVGMPSAAHLIEAADRGGAEVVDEGVPIATVKPPAASDAEGSAVQVSMSVSHGDTLVVSVSHGGSFHYPIEVDPELSGYWQAWSNVVAGNWGFHEWIGYTHEIVGSELRMKHEPGSYATNDYAYFTEKTKGYTKIFDVYVNKVELYPWSAPAGQRDTPGWLSAFIETYKTPEGQENKTMLSGSPYATEATVCGGGGCASAEGVSNGNNALVEITTTEAGSTGEQFYAHIGQVSTGIAQKHGEHSEVKYSSAGKIGGEPNVLAGGGSWIGPHSGELEYIMNDGGLGVSESIVEVQRSGSWEKMGGTNYLEKSACAGIQCAAEEHEVVSYNSLTASGAKPLPEPEAHVRVGARSYMPYSSSSEHGEGEVVLKADAKSPHGIVLSGLVSKGTEGEELELGEVEGHFKIEATDGEEPTLSSGMQWIGVEIDGHEIGSKRGFCSPGPCTTSNEWSINGAELGAGTHILTVSAVDNAGNLAKKEYELTVSPATPVALGPGSVNPESGDFAMEAHDVNLSGGMGSLGVSRHYDSRNPTEGKESPLGPQWTIDLASSASLEILPDGSALVDGPDGLTHFSVKKGGGFEAPEGDKNLTLEYEEKTPAYLFKNPAQGTTIEFTKPKGTEMWMATVSKGPVATDTVTAEYRAVETAKGGESPKVIVEPTLVLAPHPSATCTLEKMEQGCRALEFKYYEEETTAKGESESEWGGYKNRLKGVVAVVWNPSAGKIERKEVAAYRYDVQGRLRAEWDPRISPLLKTTYGYDPEGHVTAVAPPGRQPWLLRYGVTNSDSNTGRLVSATQPSAATGLWNGKALSNTAAPSLSTTSPSIGTTLNVSGNGTWSNSPLAYSYQWEDCNAEGKACTPIVGAINQSYTPQARDAGYTLVALITAENAGGVLTVATAATGAVPISVPSFSSAVGFGVSNGESKLQTCTSSCRAGIAGSGSGQFKEPDGVAVDSEGNMWVADSQNNRVEKLSSSGGFVGSYTPDSMSQPIALNVSPVTGYVYVSNTGHNRIDELSPTGALITSFGSSGPGQLNAPDSLAFDTNGDVWVADTNNNRVVEFSSSGTYMNSFGSSGSGEGQFSYPTGIAFCNGKVYVVDSGNNRVEWLSTEGKYEGQFGRKGSGNGEFNSPSRIACESTGNDLYVSDKGNNRMQMFSTAGVFLRTFGVSGHEAGQFSTPIGIAVGSAGVVYIADSANNRIEKWTPTYSTNNPLPEPPSSGSSSVSTVEYGVPVSGSGSPYAMGAKEVAAWAQTDDPVYATAIFPPDEPMGWPAKDYRRATISYMDAQARTVNAASPSGGIATSEYNEANDVVRTLSADNRAAALKEGCKAEKECKSAEVAELLDTKSKYEAGGTQMTETLGPQHTVKLLSGKGGKAEETLARAQTHYYYDEGAPEGEEYDLVTKTTSDALTAGEEFDKRTSITSYGGQKGLGWKLRKPTSTTTDPTGLNFTKTTEYDETTGNVIETKTPGGTRSGLGYSSQIGSAGEGSGQFNWPTGIALDGKGDVLVADEENARVDVFKENGVFVKSFGTWGTEAGQFLEIKGVAVDSKGDIWTDDQGNARLQEFSEKGAYLKTIGSYGTGTGQFKEPKGIAIDSHNNVWVTDTGNNRIEKFTEAGVFVAVYGFGVSNGEEKLESCTSSCRAGNPGAGNGQLEAPRELAVDSAGNIWVTDTGNNRVEEYTEKGAFIKAVGSLGTGNGQFKEPKGITIDAKGNVWVVDAENARIEELNAKGEYETQFGTEGTEHGQFRDPWGILVNSHEEVFVSDSGNSRIQKLTQSGSQAHNTKTIYYTAKGEATVPACQNHPEWVNLPCQTEPVAQPTGGLSLPVTTISYNMWNQPEKIEEAFGSTKRAKKTTFDGAGRPLTTEETSSIDEPLPAVTDAYNSETGALETQSNTVAGKAKTITSKYNRLGQLTKYTDADGGTTTYAYEEGSDGRLEEVIMDGPEGEAEQEKGKQTYSYNATTGFMEKLVDSAAGTFTAGYDVEGKMTTETYPNGMTANYTINSTGQSTGLEYKKTTHCTEHCTWFNDSVTPSVHGETLTQASTLSKENYIYDAAGRLTEVQETPTGSTCTARLYAYDEESDRTSLTTRKSSSETCPNEGGTTEHHTYDEANRLTDEGVTYEAFGDTTKLPAADAGQYALTSSYYVDGQIASQTQNEKTIAYGYDAEGRTRETKTTIKAKAEPTMTSHYAAPGEAVAWTSEESKAWTRNIPGIDGTLSATHSSSGATILQLHDLKGNIVATASISETETKLLSTYNSTEFGVPTEGKEPPKYAWLGANGVTSELSSGAIAKDGKTYVPLTGEPLQTQPIELPLPVNSYNPYEREEDSVEWGATAGALDVAEYWAAKHAAEGAGAKEESYTVDPSKLLTAKEAKILAYGLRYGGSFAGVAWPELGVFLESLEILGGNAITEAAEKLERCYKPLYEDKLTGDARCKAFVNLEFGFIPTSWGVELCWKKEYKRQNSIHITYPYCSST